jgi:putative SOS response-associated peptidase YedK
VCGRFVLMTVGRDLAERFELEEVPDLVPRYNIAPTQMIAAIRREPDKSTRRLSLLKWGLIPFWAKDSSIGSKLINARAESAPEKPAFRTAFKVRRCLIPADGFYEWKKEKGGKQPYFVTSADRKPFAFAGLWDAWKGPDGDVIESCTILTTDANDVVRFIHDRMPVILLPADYGEWLDLDLKDHKKLKSLLRGYPSEKTEIHRANPKVNKPSYDQPDCVSYSEEL